MDAHEQQPPVSEPLRSTTPIPIAKLAPALDNLSDSSIHAVVTLLWPYSSSTRSLSLLLAEPDFRLRRTNGQVKVVFHGLVAEEVAKSHVGIGDTVHIRLAGSRFVDNEVSKQTPGRCIAWDINFDCGVFIEIWRSSHLLSTVQVDRPSSPPPTVDNAIAEPPTTPPANSYLRADGTNRNTSLQSWQSPAFVERTRTSLGHLSSSIFDPFAEEDGFVPGKGRKRPRFSMRGSDWRFVDEPASPEDTDIPGDWTAMFDDEAWLRGEIGEDDAAEDTKQSPGPSETRDVISVPGGAPDGAQPEGSATELEQAAPEPSAEKKSDDSRSDAEFLVPGVVSRTEAPSPRKHGIPHFAGHLPIDTPRLHPIPSPGLPVPSPLVSTSNSPFGYFGSVPTTGQIQPSPPTSVIQEATDLALEAISEMPPNTTIRNPDEHVNTTVEEELTTLSEPTSQMREVDSGSRAHAVPLLETITERARETEAMHTQDTTSSVPIVETTTPHEAYTSGVAGGDREVAMSREEEWAEVEEDEEGLEEPGQYEAQMDSSMAPEEKGFHHSVVRTTQHDLEGEDHESESASQSSVIEDARSEVYGEEDVSEEDEQPQSRSRHDIELISESEAASPAKAHDSARRGYGYYAEEDEEEELDEEDEISNEEEPESEELENAYDDDEDGYDDRVDSGLESEGDELETESPHPIRKVEPEVIVLDSDSDEEPSPSVQRQPATTPAATHTREPDVSPSADEASSYGTSESGEYDEYESEEVDDAEGEDASDEEDEKAGEWFVRDNQEAQERGVEPVEVDLIRQSRETERDEELHSDDVQVARESTMGVHSDGEGAVSVEQVEHGQQSEEDVDMDDDQRDAGDADVNYMEAGSVQDEEMHDLQAHDDQVSDEQGRDERAGVEKAHDEHADSGPVEQERVEEEQADTRGPEVVHIEDEATEDHHPEGYEGSNHAESAEGAVLRPSSEGAKQSIEIDGHPDSHVDHEELRTTEIISHEADREDSPYAQEDVHIAQQAGASESTLHYPEPPIDPELLNAGTFSAETRGGLHGADTIVEQIEGGEDAGVPEQAHHIDPSLSLDGASQSLSLTESAVLVPKMPIIPQDQLVTPEPSQINGVDISSVPALTMDAAPPTPEPTQERSALQLEDELQPTLGIVAETTATVEVDNLPPDEDAKSEARSISTAPEEHAISDDEDKGAHTTHSEDEVLLVGHDRKYLLNLNRNYPGLRSKYSYFAPLATLIDHYNALTDTISIVSETRPAIRATTGKKDYILTFGVTDPSLAGTILYAQIFRPYKTALPNLEEGNAILLRNFRVKSFKHSITLSSVDSSAWAVFNGSSEAQIDGPPVEYGAEEQTYATDLRQWYHEDGMAMVADYQLQASIEQESREATPFSTGGFSDSGSVNNVDGRADSSFSSSRGSGSGSRRRKSHRRITIHELRDGRRYAEVGSPSSKEDIHELRDGTVYANF
ncbi:hypothetical protein ASPBRDRAFT_198061 [Aspergillus brasiliensis CBS 101740]|uniref:Telomeric single stranded DNA binding POT1/Cdc13 domain-containing protein n=1 Tax=Aspergillus brasiliensis (strain CBS 101740 / IMI 381727 / IBT 21946) TaxID=767769 RepID=A0A1L9UCK8_ASPBC|nr:hypothetical protein ASPBRDRAFT_198061 [Aspergillus brasiliensis CBS 101740]